MDLGTRALTLSLGGDDVTMEITNTRIVGGAADADDVTFAEAKAGGGREYRLQGTARQRTDAGSISDLIWTSSGTTIAAVVAPNGGSAPSVDTPTYSGNVVITEPDGDLVGGAANSSPTAKFSLDFDFPFTAKPVRATTA